MNDFREDWEKGKEGELKFWRGWFARKGHEFQRERRLSGLFDFMIGDKKEVKIANLGAGAINLIGNRRRDIEVTVVASDVLANEYKKIREELGISSPIPIEKQDMAHLTYKDEEFDIVHCTNALDHSLDPCGALKEMVRVCKPGGWIYLQHQAHEGRRLGYHGMHKWNIDITEDGVCEFWNKDREHAFLLMDIYPGFKNTIRDIGKAKIITSFVQKT